MRNTVVTDYRSIKAAALYFDFVIPAFPLIDVSDEVVRDLDDFLVRDINDIHKSGGSVTDPLPAICQKIFSYAKSSVSYDQAIQLIPPGIKAEIDQLNFITFGALLSLLHAKVNIGNEDSCDFDLGMRVWKKKEAEANEILNNIGIGRLPLWRSLEFKRKFHDTPEEDEKIDILVSLADVPLIDDTMITWQQIVEVRRDSVAMSKLRGFREFFRTNFDGRSLSYIEDSLNRRMDDYNEEAKKQDWSLVDATLDVVSKSDGIISALAGGLVVAGKGHALSVVGTGVCVMEIGKIAVRVLKTNAERRRGLVSHDMAYIAHLRRGLSVSQSVDPPAKS